METYFEYLLGDPGYEEENMFIMQRISQVERLPYTDEVALTTDNKMLVGLRMWMGWGIGWLKHMFQRLMKWYDATKQNYNHLFSSYRSLDRLPTSEGHGLCQCGCWNSFSQ
jgi:hypothetical protein